MVKLLVTTYHVDIYIIGEEKRKFWENKTFCFKKMSLSWLGLCYMFKTEENGILYLCLFQMTFFIIICEYYLEVVRRIDSVADRTFLSCKMAGLL